MGIDGIENLTVGEFIEKVRTIDRDDYHVVIVGQAGKDKRGTGIYLVGPGPKSNAILTGEKAYQSEFKVKSSVALQSKVAATGTVPECEAFITRLEDMLKEDNS